MDLTQQEAKENFEYEPDTGILYWRECSRCHTKRVPTRSKHYEGYLQVRAANKSCLVHRVIWVLVHGSIPPGMFIDHINHDRADNRLANLRLVDSRGNSKNLSIPKNNKSGAAGVYYYDRYKKWEVKVGRQYIGRYRNRSYAVKKHRQALEALGFHPNHGGSRVQ